MTRLFLSAGAAARLTEIQEQIEPRLAPGGDLHSMADWTGRHHGRAARIAGLLHLCERPPSEPISEATMRDALRISAYLLEHGIAALSGPDASLRTAVRWLEKHGEGRVTQRDLHRGPLAGRGPAEAAAVLAERLEALAVLRRDVVEHAGPGRPPSPAYDVHPSLAGRCQEEVPVPPPDRAADPTPQAPVTPPSEDGDDQTRVADLSDEELLATFPGSKIEHLATNGHVADGDVEWAERQM